MMDTPDDPESDDELSNIIHFDRFDAPIAIDPYATDEDDALEVAAFHRSLLDVYISALPEPANDNDFVKGI